MVVLCEAALLCVLVWSSHTRLHTAAHMVAVCGLTTQLHLRLCSMWSQCDPDHLPEVHLQTCTFM